MMACHGSPEGAEGPCWGWARQVGWHHHGARVMAMARTAAGRAMAAALAAGPDPTLHASWDEVIEKLRRTT